VEFASEVPPVVPQFRRQGQRRFDVFQECPKICQPTAVQAPKGQIKPSISLGSRMNRRCLNKRWL
jgi:hypothetical protein